MDPSCANESLFYGSNQKSRPKPKKPDDHVGPPYARAAPNLNSQNYVPPRKHLIPIENSLIVGNTYGSVVRKRKSVLWVQPKFPAEIKKADRDQ